MDQYELTTSKARHLLPSRVYRITSTNTTPTTQTSEIPLGGSRGLVSQIIRTLKCMISKYKDTGNLFVFLATEAHEESK